MKAANEALKQAQQELKTAEKNQKEVEKDVKKDNKAAKKEAKKEEKAIAKAEKEQRKAIEKEQKSAEKDLKKANKKIEKLEEKCAKGKCDDEDLADLAAARASAESAQTALDAANQKANAFYAQDEDEAAAEYMAERDAQEASIAAAEDADGIIEQAKEDLAEAQSNAPKMCSADEIGGNVFLLIACKATTTLADLRVIAYIISGFGMVALAYAAIFGKMNWKHLANIGIGLFLLSMMTPFIEYFTTGKDNTLRFGKYLPAGFSDIQGSDGQVTDCDEDLDKNSTFCNQILPEVTVTGKKQKWSLKDLKGSITAGLDAVRNASDMYKAAKSTVSNVKSAVSNMTAQIKSGGGGLDGIINAAGAVANATGTIVNSGQVLANNIATNAGNLSNNIRDAGSTNAAREARAEAQETLDKLTKKCNAGNCSEQEKKYMEQMEETVNNNKTGVNKWLENDGAGGGSTILSGINKVGNIANNASNSVKNVANAANEGQSIGGDGALGKILGVGFGVGTAVTEGMDTAEQSKQNGMFDFRSDATKREEQAKAEEEAFKKTSGYVKNTQTTADGKKVETLGDGSVRTTSKDGKTVTTVNKDGTTTTTKDGTTVVKSPDGSRTVTDSAGNKVTYDAKGNKVKTELVNEYNRATAESVKEALNGKKEEEKKEEKKEEKPAATTQKSNDVMTDADKKQRSDLCDKQSEGVRADCKICANKNTKSEYKSCMKELQNKLNAAANAAANQEMEKWCKQKGAKEECFYAPEGADANLTAACKKCGFKMASPSK
jgi:histone H1